MDGSKTRSPLLWALAAAVLLALLVSLLLALRSEGEGAGGSVAQPEGRIYASEEQVLAELMARVDQDGDQRISRHEYRAVENRREPFQVLDADGDGYGSLQELERAVFELNPGFADMPDLDIPRER